MRKLEELLLNKKAELENIEIPENLEARLQQALKTKCIYKRKKKSWRTLTAAVMIALLFIGYNFDTLAYYGKRLAGYDGVMNGTLKELNELGKGQVIGESYIFKNGVIVTLDGIMLDENQLLAFYTLKDSHGAVDRMEPSPHISLKGFWGTYRKQRGQGEMNEGKTEIKWIMGFQTPRFFEKTLDFQVDMRGEDFQETGKITFILDRNKAMGHTLKKSINQYIEVDETKIYFDDILASPTGTVIKGKIRGLVDLAKDELREERFRPNHLKVRLIANGEEVEVHGGGISTDMKGMTFHMDYDALPPSLESLELELVSFSADHDIKQQIDLDKDGIDKTIEILGQNIEINKVYEVNGNTYITITSEENTVLTKVFLWIDGNKVELERTSTENYNKLTDGTITHARTLCFPSTGEQLKLDIQKMSYVKEYNKAIDIPIQ